MQEDPIQEEDDKMDVDDPEYLPNDDTNPHDSGHYTYENFKQTLESGIRLGLSNRQLASMINSTLVDLKVEDKNRYVCTSTVRKMKLEYGKKIEEDHLKKNQRLVALGLDSTKSDCKVERGQTEIIENISFTNQVEKTYLDHGRPKNSKAETIHPILYEVNTKYITLHKIEQISEMSK